MNYSVMLPIPMPYAMTPQTKTKPSKKNKAMQKNIHNSIVLNTALNPLQGSETPNRHITHPRIPKIIYAIC